MLKFLFIILIAININASTKVTSLVGYTIGDKINKYNVKKLDNAPVLQKISAFKKFGDNEFTVSLELDSKKRISEIVASVIFFDFDFKKFEPKKIEKRYEEIIDYLEKKYKVNFKKSSFKKPWKGISYEYSDENTYRINYNLMSDMVFIEYKLFKTKKETSKKIEKKETKGVKGLFEEVNINGL